MKIHKIIFLILICCFSITIAKCYNYFDFVVDEYSKLIPFWQKMESCTPYTVSIPYVNPNSSYVKELPDIADKKKVYKVIGIEDDCCHVKMQSYDCHFPISIAKEYARTKRAYSEKKIAEIKKNKNYNVSSSDAEIQKIAQYNNSYCKLQFYVPERVKIN